MEMANSLKIIILSFSAVSVGMAWVLTLGYLYGWLKFSRGSGYGKFHIFSVVLMYSLFVTVMTITAVGNPLNLLNILRLLTILYGNLVVISIVIKRIHIYKNEG